MEMLVKCRNRLCDGQVDLRGEHYCRTCLHAFTSGFLWGAVGYAGLLIVVAFAAWWF